MGYMYGSGWENAGWILLKAIVFIFASFVFSLVFWLTKVAVDRAPEMKKTAKAPEKVKKKQ